MLKLKAIPADSLAFLFRVRGYSYQKQTDRKKKKKRMIANFGLPAFFGGGCLA